MENNEDNKNVEISDELQYDDVSNEEVQEISSISFQNVDELNTNLCISTLGIVTCLGFVFGALLGSVYVNITR